MSGNVHSNPFPVFPCSVCAGKGPGGVGQCNAAHALIGFIQSAHYSPFLDSELLAALTPGAAILAASLLFLEIPHLPSL